MKFVPEADRSVWHEKAMDAAKKADLGCVIDLFVGTNETNRLAELAGGTSDEALD